MNPPTLLGTWRSDSRARAAYSEGAGIYRIVPEAVAIPADQQDVATLIQWARSTRTSLVPRGAGSAMTGSSVGHGVVVDLSRLAPRRLEIDPVSRTAVTSSGIALAELQAAAQQHQLRLPPDPASARWATAGGVFSTDAAGPRSVRYGTMRRWIVGCTGVTSDAETFRIARGSLIGSAPAAFHRLDGLGVSAELPATDVAARGPRTRKNTSGYALPPWREQGDLTQLLIGSEGTLAIITEITWQLDAIPAERASLRVDLRSLEPLGPLVSSLLPTGPSACELLDRTFLDVARRGHSAVPAGEAVLLLEYEGATRADVDDAANAAERVAASLGVTIIRANTLKDAESLRELRHAASPILATLPESTRSLQVVEDGCVPVERLSEYVALLRRAAASRGIPIVLFGHAGDGHVHANLLPDVTRPGWEAPVASLFEEVSEGVIGMGGTPSGEHGDGRLRARLLPRVYGDEAAALMQDIKSALDPDHILNPGVILPAGAPPPLAQLKVGADAAPIPPDIADALRRIERTGGYGTSRLEIADR